MTSQPEPRRGVVTRFTEEAYRAPSGLSVGRCSRNPGRCPGLPYRGPTGLKAGQPASNAHCRKALRCLGGCDRRATDGHGSPRAPKTNAARRQSTHFVWVGGTNVAVNPAAARNRCFQSEPDPPLGFNRLVLHPLDHSVRCATASFLAGTLRPRFGHRDAAQNQATKEHACCSSLLAISD